MQGSGHSSSIPSVNSYEAYSDGQYHDSPIKGSGKDPGGLGEGPGCEPEEFSAETGLTVTMGFAEMVSRSISVAAPVSLNIVNVLLYDPVVITLPSPDMDRLSGK